MPAYSPSSMANLNTCHLDLQTLFIEVGRRYNCTIICGHRDEVSQQEAFDAGLSQVHFPDSKHNSYPSMAVDAAPYFTEIRNIDWQDVVAFALFAGYVKRVAEQLLEQGKIEHELRWGGDWDSDGRNLDQNFNDMPHFELVKPRSAR